MVTIGNHHLSHQAVKTFARKDHLQPPSFVRRSCPQPLAWAAKHCWYQWTGKRNKHSIFSDQTSINLRDQNKYKYGSTKTLRETTCGVGKGWINKKT